MDRRSLLFLISVTFAFFLVKAWYTPHLPQKPMEEAVQKPPVSHISPALGQGKQENFVLESPYQQVVISAKGGSIVEINLPFKSKQYPNSVVLPVENDVRLQEQVPQDDRFPSVAAQTCTGATLPQQVGGYLPLLRRNLAPQYAALSLSSPFPELASLPYTVTSFTPTSITLEAKQPHRRIIKTFSFPKKLDQFPYCIDVEISIDGDRKDVCLTSGIPEIEWVAGSSGATLKYRILRGNSGSVELVDLPKTAFSSTSIQPDWVCNSNGFFGIIIDPLAGQGSGVTFTKIPGSVAPSRVLLIDQAQARHAPDDLPGYEATIPFSQTTPTMKLRYFAGPFAETILKKIDTNSTIDYNKPTNYLSCQTFHGWFAFISEPFAKFLFVIMKLCHAATNSWGLSIILTTVVLRILMYPLNRWSLRSMRSMQEIAPLVKSIQERHKKDPQKAQMEVMALYREKKVNPFSGCLPLLIQMPFLIGMFDLLKTSFELRGAPFIPGWINDLSAPDVAFDWKYNIFLLGHQLHILPIILGGTMWIQQYMSANLPKNPSEWTEQQRQQRAMGNIMTVVMTVMFYQFPSGLNIYWISSMLLGIVQQWWTTRTVGRGKP